MLEWCAANLPWLTALTAVSQSVQIVGWNVAVIHSANSATTTMWRIPACESLLRASAELTNELTLLKTIRLGMWWPGDGVEPPTPAFSGAA
jgi:hypothetical protein